MRISYNCLKKYISLSEKKEILCQWFNQLGLEVKSVSTFLPIPEKVIIGKIIDVQKHHSADKLQQVKLLWGEKEDPLNIICGATNLCVGAKVAVALPSAILSPDLIIKERKIRGIISEGMICSAQELGLSSLEKEIDEEKNDLHILLLPEEAVPGQTLSSFLGLSKDWIFDLDINLNRGDLLSHYGVARELAAFSQKSLKNVLVKPLISGNESLSVHVSVKDEHKCSRYTSMLMQNITVKPSPIWLQKYLQSFNIRPINNIVDVSNWIMHSFGQPMHIYDYDAIKDKRIVIQSPSPNTTFVTLHNQKIKLQGDEIIVCDGQGALSLAGIIGGKRGMVNETTKNILIEVACFDSQIIRKVSSRHNIQTESSYRFERNGVDITMMGTALRHAVYLLLDIAGGSLGSSPIDCYFHKKKPIQFTFSLSQTQKILGFPLEKKLFLNILERLSVTFIEENEEDGTFLVSIPAFRSNVIRPIDLIGEILRIYGCNKVVSSSIKKARIALPRQYYEEQKWKNFLLGKAVTEIRNQPFDQSSWYKNSRLSNFLLRVKNPVTQNLDILRASLLFSGLQSIRENFNKGQSSIRFFEFGNCYQLVPKTKEKKEFTFLAIWLTGKTVNPHWDRKPVPFKLHHLYRLFLELVDQMGLVCPEIQQKEHPWFKEVIEITIGGVTQIYLGEVKPNILLQFGIKEPVFFVEAPWTLLIHQKIRNKTYSSSTKLPPIERDISFLLPNDILYAKCIQKIHEAKIDRLCRYGLIDTYQGEPLPQGKVSYTFRFFFNFLEEERKLPIIKKVVDEIEKNLKTLFLT